MPSAASVFTTDLLLSNMAIAHGRNTYLSDQVFPVMDSPIKTGKVKKLDPNFTLMRSGDFRRAPGSEAQAIDAETSNPVTFNCEDHALVRYVPDELKAVMNPPEQAFINSVQWQADLLALEKEVALVTLLAATLTSTLTSSPTNKWNASNGDPIADITAKMALIEESKGVTPNALAMDVTVARALRDNVDVQDRIKYTGAGGAVPFEVVARAIADTLGIADVFIANISVKNTGPHEGTASLSRVWGENVLLFRRESPGPEYAGLGLTVTWNSGDQSPEGEGGLVGGYRVARFREPKRKSEGIMTSRYYDQQVMDSVAGHWFTNTLA